MELLAHTLNRCLRNKIKLFATNVFLMAGIGFQYFSRKPNCVAYFEITTQKEPYT